MNASAMLKQVQLLWPLLLVLGWCTPGPASGIKLYRPEGAVPDYCPAGPPVAGLIVLVRCDSSKFRSLFSDADPALMLGHSGDALLPENLLEQIATRTRSAPSEFEIGVWISRRANGTAPNAYAADDGAGLAMASSASSNGAELVVCFRDRLEQLSSEVNAFVRPGDVLVAPAAWHGSPHLVAFTAIVCDSGGLADMDRKMRAQEDAFREGLKRAGRPIRRWSPLLLRSSEPDSAAAACVSSRFEARMIIAAPSSPR